MTAEIKGEFNKNKPGKYEIEVIVKDLNNNETRKIFTIEVIELKRINFKVSTNYLPSDSPTSDKVSKKILENFKKGQAETIFRWDEGYDATSLYHGTYWFSEHYLGAGAWDEIEFLVDYYYSPEEVKITITNFAKAQKYYNKKKSDNTEYKKKIYNIMSNMNLYTTQEDMVQQINNYIVNNITYKLTNDLNMATLLRTKKGKCWHYAMLFRDMCYAVGIKSAYVEGYAYGDHHAWNYVIIDGKKYYFDTTLNDSMKTNKWSFVSEATLRKTHSW